MKKSLLLIAGLICFAFLGKAQNANIPAPQQGDTASFPYWIQMMQDPNANFFKTQRAFNIYWQNRKITRGCGWKVFKRWEYMMRSRINADGSRPAPDAITKAYEQYQKSAYSTNGTWVSMGPSQIPSPGPAG